MRLCVFEDNGIDNLEPLTLTRPAFDLWCGASTLLEKQTSWALANPNEVGVLIRPSLVDFTQFLHAGVIFNDPDWQKEGPTAFVNARWLPEDYALDDETPRVGMIGDQVAYVIGSPGPESYPEGLEDWLKQCVETLPATPAGGVLVDFLWDLVDHNPDALRNDLHWFRNHRTLQDADVKVLGENDKLLVAEGATVEPFVIADTRGGPIFIEPGAIVNSFSRLEGPLYIGRDSWICGAKMRGGTIGPGCRIGGEFEASIMQGNSNKYHDGFLGHSYIGQWVNLAAGTQTSDLRNDYGTVKVTVNGQRVATGRTKVGSFIGDHTKTGLGALFNTGTVVGVFCNILPSGFLSPTVVPSFVQVKEGQLQERSDLRTLFQTATTAMRRRGFELTDAHREFFFQLYEKTAKPRTRLVQEVENRRLRKSV